MILPELQVERRSGKPVDIFKVLNHYDIKYQQGKEEGYIEYLCPFHADEHFGSASMRVHDGLWYCFSCGEGGNMTMFVSKKDGVDTKEAYRRLQSTFIFDETYDEEAWREHLNAFPQGDFARYKYHEQSQKIVEQILNQLCEKPRSPELLADWIGLCSWLNVPSVEINNDLCDRQILDIYKDRKSVV